MATKVRHLERLMSDNVEDLVKSRPAETGPDSASSESRLDSVLHVLEYKGVISETPGPQLQTSRLRLAKRDGRLVLGLGFFFATRLADLSDTGFRVWGLGFRV